MSTLSASPEVASQSNATPTFRGQPLKEFTTSELAQICVDEAVKAGKEPAPPTTWELVQLYRAGVKLELSPKGRVFAAQNKADFSVLGL